MEELKLIAIAALAGLFLGLATYSLYSSEETGYCKQVEEKIEMNKTFNGTFACYTPDAREVRGINVSGTIANRTETACICINRFQDKERVFTINIAGQRR